MDPNEILSDIRELIAQDVRSPLHRDDVGALISRVEALDEWITRGGFLPDEWKA